MKRDACEWRRQVKTSVRMRVQVAVKVIDKKKAREDAYVCRNMRRESRLLQQIKHRNIIQLFEVCIFVIYFLQLFLLG